VRQDGKANSIPYSEDTFKTASKKMYQHRSMALAMPRTSTAIFNGKRVEWKYENSKEKALGKACVPLFHAVVTDRC
jgi:hypothetical protein